MKRPDRTFTEIASKHLNIPTLRTRKSDSLDFHDVSVWAVAPPSKLHSTRAYSPPTTTLNPRACGPTEPVPAAKPSPLVIPKGTPLLPGKMYLRLYHGRTDPAQEMDDWGFDGPTFGPLSSYVHTYCCHFRIYGECDTSEFWLEKHDDMIRWDGCFYGDMEVFVAGTNVKA